MPDFNIRSDSVNVEQIMEQIRARIREKRGVDYTEEQIQQLANVKLERFLDPRGVRSDLLEQFRRAQPPYSPPELPNYAFEEHTLFESHRGPLRWIRRLLRPILKLFFNPNPLIHALNIQAQLNRAHAEREAKNEAARHTFDALHYEVLHNLVVETTRMGIEVKNLKMRVESLTSRLEFNERRARALESVVVYRQSEDGADLGTREMRSDEARSGESPAPAAANVPQEGPGQRSRKRRRRRGRRGRGSVAGIMGAPGEGQASPEAQTDERGSAAGEPFEPDRSDTNSSSPESDPDSRGESGDSEPTDREQ